MSKTRVQKLTPDILRKIVLEERERLLKESDPIEAGIADVEKVKADEVQPEDLADTLAKDIDHMKALKIKESKLVKELGKIQKEQNDTRQRIVKILS